MFRGLVLLVKIQISAFPERVWEYMGQTWAEAGFFRVKAFQMGMVPAFRDCIEIL